MGYPDTSFVGKTAKFAITALATAVIITASSTLAHAKVVKSIESDKENIVPPYAVGRNTDSKGSYKNKNRRINRKSPNLSVSKDFKFYKQVASLDLTDPVQAETFLQFMDIRLAEKELDEEVVFVNGHEEEASGIDKTMGIDSSQVSVAPHLETGGTEKAVIKDVKKEGERGELNLKPEVEKKIAERKDDISPPVIKRDKDGMKTDKAVPGGKEAAERKEKEQTRIERATETRKAKEDVEAEKQKAEALRLAEEKRKAHEKAKVEKQKAEALRVAEEKRKAGEKVKGEKQKAETLKLAEEKRKAHEKAKVEKQKAEALKLAEEKRKAHEKVKAEKQKAEAFRVAEGKRKAEEKAKTGKQGAAELGLAEKSHRIEERRKECLEKGEKDRTTEEKAQENKVYPKCESKTEIKEGKAIVQQRKVDAVPVRPITYQMASFEKDPKIINFDQDSIRRLKVTGSYLYQGENGNNIVKDKRGREFLNVMAFWDVLVEPLNNGENRYYGSIQFPLGSRHPVIIKSTKPGDMLALGCHANEVVVLKSFETEGIDFKNGLIDAYLAHSIVMPDGSIAFQEVVRQPSFSLINVESGCMPRNIFSRSDVDPERMGHDKALDALPVRE